MLSLLAVFRDVAPAYRIRLPTDKELTIKVSKEVQQTRDYERTFLAAYQVCMYMGANTVDGLLCLRGKAQGIFCSIIHMHMYILMSIYAVIPQAPRTCEQAWRAYIQQKSQEGGIQQSEHEQEQRP